jgi:predicted RNA binding protein YcfA (HicA-like mRNA interferase family)
MKRFKVIEILRMLKKDGWYLDRTKGDHRQFKHSTKKGTVTVRGKLSEDISPNDINSIFKQAGWRN